MSVYQTRLKNDQVLAIEPHRCFGPFFLVALREVALHGRSSPSSAWAGAAHLATNSRHLSYRDEDETRRFAVHVKQKLPTDQYSSSCST
jgi:hypothetical protein